MNDRAPDNYDLFLIEQRRLYGSGRILVVRSKEIVEAPKQESEQIWPPYLAEEGEKHGEVHRNRKKS